MALSPTMICPKCQSEVPGGFRFCGHCGAPVETAAASSEQRIADDAERRPLTVIFCDLADSTQLAERLDPEDLREVVRSYQSAATTVVEDQGGHVAQYLGDGILVYFGYPEAHEDDPLRAVRASLHIVDAIRDLGEGLQQSRGISLAVRLGVHTGLVVAGDVGSGERHERLAMGSTPNIAARLQGIAAPNTVVVSDASRRLVEGFFELEPLGEHTLKGREKPMAVYRAVGETGAQTRFDVAMARGLSPAVGRDEQLTFLNERLADAQGGAGQAVLVAGEAGIGKSRLMQLFREQDDANVDWLTSRCAANEQDSALRPIARLLASLFHVVEHDDGETRLRKMADGCEARSLPAAEAVPLLAPLLSVDPGEAYPPLHLGPVMQKTKTHEVLLALLLSASADRHVVLAVEDLHWADPSTLQILTQLTQRVADARTLLLCTARPDFVAPWEGAEHVSTVQLERLERADVEALVSSITGGRSLPRDVVDQLVAKTDGVPLYIEELTKMILESGLVAARNGHYERTGAPGPLAIPDTLHDSLVARLDRLGAIKATAQLASVIGREFQFSLIQAVADMDGATLEEHLSHLVDVELLFQQGSFPSSTYVFKHALVQDAAYQSLLRTTRRRYHQSIADSLFDRFPELRQTQPDLLAHHFTEAGNVGLAVEFHVAAGDRAVALSGTVEAITHYQRAIALLENAPADVEPERREMEVQTRLGDVLSSAQGYGAPDVATAYRRAEALAERVGDAPRLFEILHGIFRFHHTRAELDISLDLGERMVERAKHQGTSERVEAAASIGNAHWARGEFAEGIPYVDEALAEDLEERGKARYTGPPVVTAEGVRELHHRCVIRTTAGLLLTHMGHLDRAMGLADEALAMSRDAALPYSEAWVLYNKTLLHFVRREHPATGELAGQLMAVSQSHGYFFITLGMVLSGWAMANGEDPASRADGIALALQGLNTFRSLGARVSQTMYLTALAEAHLAGGDTPLAQSSLDEAAMAIEITGERLWLPELHRVRGDVALRAELIDDAESQYREAMTIAQRQSNRLLEVRAAVALARCLESHGDGAAAREALQPAVARFPEDTSVPDLRDAAALLAQLPVSS